MTTRSLLTRRAALRGTLLAGSALWLPRAQACEFYARHLKVVHPWTRATGPDADSASVCMVFDEVIAPDRLVGVSTPVAQRAEMAGPGTASVQAAVSNTLGYDIPAGQTSAFTEAGTHVRLLGLNHPLEVARAYPMTLHFQASGPLQVLLTVDYERFR